MVIRHACKAPDLSVSQAALYHLRCLSHTVEEQRSSHLSDSECISNCKEYRTVHGHASVLSVT